MMVLISLLLQAAAQPTPVGFQDFTLGSSIETIRGKPADSSDGEAKIMCSDEPGFPRFVAVTPDYKRLNVLRCIPVAMVAGELSRAWVRLSPDFNAPLDLYFYKGRLVEITLAPDLEASSSVASGLRSKFGPSTSQKAGTFQTEAGAVYPSQSIEWRLPTATVTMETPSLSLKKMVVVYRDRSLGAELDAALAADPANRARM